MLKDDFLRENGLNVKKLMLVEFAFYVM